jgi:hypothetical protein
MRFAIGLSAVLAICACSSPPATDDATGSGKADVACAPGEAARCDDDPLKDTVIYRCDGVGFHAETCQTLDDTTHTQFVCQKSDDGAVCAPPLSIPPCMPDETNIFCNDLARVSCVRGVPTINYCPPTSVCFANVSTLEVSCLKAGDSCPDAVGDSHMCSNDHSGVYTCALDPTSMKRVWSFAPASSTQCFK